ncbi:transposase [Ralstonia sp. GX3-BWBA]|nr:transposase [Ralstonia sp. GX3-BWBA]
MNDFERGLPSVPPEFSPQVGMRFCYRGSEFEIAHVAYREVRYNAVAGGQSHRLPIARLQEEVRSGAIVLTTESKAIQESPYLTLSAADLQERTRQLRYAQGAIAELEKPTSHSALFEWIKLYAEKLSDPHMPGVSSVARWVKALRDFGEAHFINKPRRKGNSLLRFSVGVEAGIQQGIADFMRAERRSSKNVLAHVHGYLLENNMTGTNTPSQRTIRRRINKIDPYLLMRVKDGPIAAERAAKASGRSHQVHMPMYFVQIDSHVLDVLVVDESTREVMGRPTLVLAIDVRTRCIVGWHLSMHPPSTVATLAVVKDMFTRPLRGLPGGICVHLIPDNGTEFKNSAVMRLLLKANVIIEPAAVREPNHKPHVESFFRTLTRSLVQTLPGTTFSNPAERGSYDSSGCACLTLEQVRSYVDEWIEEIYHKQIHSGTGRAPIMMWKEETAPGKCKPLTMTEEEVNVIARTVVRSTPNGGRVRHDGLAWYSHALRTLEHQYKGPVAVLIDELDLDKVYIEHPLEQGLIITAMSTTPEYTRGLTKWGHREAKRMLSQLSQRDRRELGENAPLYSLYMLMQRIQKDSAFATKQMKRLRESKKELDKQVEKVTEVAFAMEPVVLSSRIDAIAGGPPAVEHVDPDTGEVLQADRNESTRLEQTQPVVGDLSLGTFILD